MGGARRREGEARAVSPAATHRPISRDDIEAKLRQIRGGVDTEVEQVESKVKAAVIVVVLVVVVAAFLVGRRRGRKRRTIVEVRRI